MKTKFIFIFLSILVSGNVKGEEMLLTPIGLKFSMPTNHWGGVIKRKDPDNFELFLMQDGKAKMFLVGTHKSETESFDTDINEFEKSLEAGNCTNLHKEFIVFLGHKCCKLNGEFPAQTYISKRSLLVYVFYARGLCYEMSAYVAGANPPGKDSDIQEILGSMAFIQVSP